jgi:hypothetical protein
MADPPSLSKMASTQPAFEYSALNMPVRFVPVLVASFQEGKQYFITETPENIWYM